MKSGRNTREAMSFDDALAAEGVRGTADEQKILGQGWAFLFDLARHPESASAHFSLISPLKDTVVALRRRAVARKVASEGQVRNSRGGRS